MSSGMADAAGRGKSAIVAVAESLPRINTLTIEAFSMAGDDNAGCGRGRVRARRVREDVIRFEESGRFELGHGPTLNFLNALRWTLEPDRIVLAHCRQDAEVGTRLVEFRPPPRPCSDADLTSAAPHPCGQDRYAAVLKLADGGFDLVWQVTGPRKQQRLIHRYRRVAFGGPAAPADERG